MITYISIFILAIVSMCILLRLYSDIALKKTFRQKQSMNDFAHNCYSKSKKAKIFSYIKKIYTAFYYICLRYVGYIPSFTVRHCLYKNVFLVKIGKGSKIRAFCEIIAPWNLTIGQNCMIGQECKLDARNRIIINNNVNISDQTAIWTAEHDAQDPNFGLKGGPVTIEDNVWLSFRSTILPNIIIHHGAVVAACALASKNLESNSLYTGIPCKKIKDREPDVNYNLDLTFMKGL